MTSGDPRTRSRQRSRRAEVFLVTAQELRLLLGLLLVLFVTSETWRYIGRLPLPRLALLLTAVLGGAFLVATVGVRRVPSDSVARRMRRRAVSRAVLEVVAFGGALLAVFTVLGAATMDELLVAEWTGVPVADVAPIDLGVVVVTRALVQVAAFLAVLGALAFAVEVVVDPDTRETLLGDLLEEAPADDSPSKARPTSSPPST